MVDTINPQTGKEDEFTLPGQAAQPAQDTFYSGFSKPEEVHVNLAAENQTGATPAAPKADSLNSSGSSTPQGTDSATAPGHQVYAANKLNWLPILFAVSSSFVFILITFFVTSLVSKNIFEGKLQSEVDSLSALEQEYQNELAAARPLELPVEAPTSETPAVIPTEEVEESPVVNPEPVEVPVQPSSAYSNGQG